MGRVSGVTDLLGNTLADPHGHLLVLVGAVLPGHVLALLERLVGADLVRNLPALLPRDVLADLLGHVVTDGVSHLPLLGLGGALGLSVRLVLRLVLVHTHTLVHGLAALLVHCLALLSGGGLAQPLVHGVADLLVVGDALLGLLLLVLGVPDGGVLGPALDGASVEPGRVRWSVHSIVWSSCGQADQEGGEDWSHLCCWSPVSVPM